MEYERAMAESYDAVYAKLRDPVGDREWYRGLAIAAGGPVLELGCGTGRVLLPIAEAGIPVTGVDPSAEMLRVLRGKNPPANVSLVQSTMETFDLEEREFALVYIPFRAFQHLLDTEAQLAALHRIRAHLRAGGTLALDVFDPNPARMALADEPEVEDVRYELNGTRLVRLVSVRRDRVTQTMDVHFRYTEEDGRTLGVEIVRMRWIWRYELEHLLARCGFEPQRWSSGYDGRPYDARGDIVVVTRRV